MSSVVAETSTQPSNPVAKPKSGTNGQASAGNGFSGLVDSNLAAAAEGEARPAPTKPRKSERAAPADQQPARTGVHRKAKSAEPLRKSATDEKPTQPEGAKAAESTAEATLVAEATVKTGIVGVKVSAELAEAVPEATAEPAPAPAPVTTGVVAAVTIPTDLALETAGEPTIESGDAIALSNPPATLATPTGTAANALAKVAADTAATGVDADAAPTQAATTEAVPDATATEAVAENDMLIETATVEVQLDAKAKTELATAAKPAVADKPVVAPEHAKLEAAVKIEPAKTGEAAASEQPSVAKPVTHDDHRVEAKPAAQSASDKSADTEAPSAQKPAPEQVAQPSAPTHTEKPQPNGAGLTQVAALHVPTVALQSAAFTAVAATSAPVPINGLAVEIAANVQIGRSRFEIRLDPPELGRIDVRLDVDKHGQVTSHLIVEKSATLDLLRRDAQQLERALQDAGLKTSDQGLQFSLRDQSQSGRQDEGSQRNGQRLIITEEETIAAEAAGRSYGRMIGQRGGIDIRV